MNRVLIFGGSGFIGHHVTEYFLAEGDDSMITLADLNAPAHQAGDRVRFVRCDVRQPIDDSIGPADLIVNLAAVHRTPGHRDHEYHETNERGARNVTEFAARNEIQRIWFTSSISVYGPDESPKSESSPPSPVSAYGKSKLAAEKIHEEWARSAPGRKLTVARPATVFGPGEGGNFTRLARAIKRRTFFYPGRRDTLKACGYVTDLAPSFAYMERFADPVEVYNFAYPKPPTIEQVCNGFAIAGGLPKPWLSVPAGLLLGAGAVLDKCGIHDVNPERVKKLMVSTNVVGNELQQRGFEFECDLVTGMRRWLSEPPAGEFV